MKFIRNCILSGVAMIVAISALAQEGQIPIYLNTAYTFEERATDLVSRFTLEEKQALLGNNMAAVPRLGVKGYNIWSEALHGVLSGANPSVGIQGPSSFPNSVATGSTWDPALVERMASAIADEARAIFQTGTKGLTFWSPVVEPVRDPRWGRTGESYGEDPFLAAEMARGFVRGLMGTDPKYLKAVPTAKHYFANNSEFDRHVSSSNMDSRDLREFYTYPYKRLIEDENLPSIMSSYNAVNHVPTSASVFYLDTLARRTWGMKGYVTGDCAAIQDIWDGHYFVETREQATAAGLHAGVDSDCGSVYQRYAISAYEQGILPMAEIDRALINMFTIRMRTGEFDPEQMVPYTKFEPSRVNSAANQALAAELAVRTPVLLKNDNQALPIDASKIRSIALIGPQADDVELGPYSGRPEATSMISPYAGITKWLKAKGYDVDVMLATGGDIKSKSNLLYIAYFEIEKTDGSVTRYDATKYTASAEGITVGSGMGTEEQVRSIDDGTWTAYDNVDITNIENITVGLNIPTEGGIVEIRVGGPDGNLIGRIEATKSSGARVGGVYGASMPMKTNALKLGYNGPQTVYLVYKAPQDAPIDEATIEMARKADVAVIFVGTDENTATEEADRLTLTLPGNQIPLIKAVAAVNPRTIVYMQTLGCVEVEEFCHLANIPAIIWTGYNGMAQGEAVPRILFGEVSPGGKLNATWFKTVKDLPAITDYNLRRSSGNVGRTLWYFNREVSYPFGYGLSYTTFEYSNFRISKSNITPNDVVTLSVDVTNTGKYSADEVVQIYVATPDSPAALERPAKRLKGFKRVTIPRGQTRTVSIDIKCSDLWFWDMNAERMTFDQGRYVFEFGSSSADIRGTVSANMSGKLDLKLKTLWASTDANVLNIGQTAHASYSVCLNDDSFDNSARGTWRSSNPSVASVAADGTITARSMGVATITCTATVGGVTKEDSFAIKVMPEMTLASLKVDGKAVKVGDASQLSFLRKAGKAPVVAAVAKDPAIAVNVKQAAAVPGTAVVTLADENTGDCKEIAVNFGTKGVSDTFQKSALGSQWSWVRENPALWSLSERPGSIVLTSGKGDIVQAGNDAQNILLQEANADWTVDTKLTCLTAPAAPAQNAGLVAYQDDDNFVKFVYGAAMAMRRPDPNAAAAPAAGQLQLVVEENGAQKAAVRVPMDGIIGTDNVVWLRLVKKGDSYTAFYSVDGKKFTEAGSAQIVLKDVQAGLICCEGVMAAMGGRGGFGGAAMQMPAAAPLKAAFDDFKIIGIGLK
ncbi:MAG: glycoside hydrolase family 3 C-terminal domain-containing protein [Bacteroidales bacterium]|nr:glycoside hydrolase family 3 C-terminal domain-containing protein [Bacteroidales bacterium]